MLARRSDRIVLWTALVAIAAGVAARVLVAVAHKGFDNGDQVPYSTLATSLADHLRYAIPRAQDTFHWAPGAPALFAGGLRAFGRGASGLAGAYTVQAIVSITTVGLLYLACRRLAGARAASLACAGLALSPGAITASGDLITEPAGAALLLACAGLVALGLRSRAGLGGAATLFAAGGLALGTGILVRPDFLILAPTCAGVVLLGWAAPLRRRVAGAVALLTACAVVVAPWCMWATSRAGQLVLPTTSGASSFWVGTHLPSDGLTRRARTLLANEVHARFPDTHHDPSPLGVDMMRTVASRRPALDRNAAIREETRANLRRYALGRPGAFARMQARKVSRMWSRPYAGHNRDRTWWGRLLHVPAVLAALVTLVAAVRLGRGRPELVVVAAIIVAGTAFNSLAAVQPRSNVRFVPLAFLGAALAMGGPRNAWPRGIARPGLGAAAVIAVALALALATDRGPVGEPRRDPLAYGEVRRDRLLFDFGVDPRRRIIRLGVLSALTGPQAELGRAVTSGEAAYWRARNRAGGVLGWRIRLVRRDTAGGPRRHRAALKALLPRVAALQQSFGYPNTRAVLGATARRKLLVGVAEAREASLFGRANLLIVGAPYAVDVANALAELAARRPAARTGLVYEGNAIGRDGVAGYSAAQAAHRIRDVARIKVEAGDDGPAARLRAAGAEAVVVSAGPDVALSLLTEARRIGYRPRWILQDTAWRASYAARLTRGSPRIWLTSPAAAGAHQPAFALGYGQAAVMARVLERAIGVNDLTPRSILDAKLTLGQVAAPSLAAARYTPQLDPPTRRTALIEVRGAEPRRWRMVRSFFTSAAARRLRFAIAAPIRPVR